MTSGAAITGVAEIVLSVRDLPRMRQFFYEEVLGFTLLSQTATSAAWSPTSTASRRLPF